MDLEDSTEDWPDDDILGVEELNDDSVCENEPCGICLDVVIDRGVLDSCDHWFCFACIDNWAAITNLCPACKKEFQLITCLPVYDSFENAKVDEHSLSRDEDWYIQGKSKTLSFPSFYIDEDAVICLDGGGCRIKSKLPTECELNLDTSIACDSCDIWYHAVCVGFDPEDTSHSSWLCPRCENNASQQRLDYTSEEDLSSDHEQTNPFSFQSDSAVLPGKVSISVADAGETAVVVSLVDGNQSKEETHHKDETCAALFDHDDDQFLVVNAPENQNYSEFSSEVVPEKTVIHGNEPGTHTLVHTPEEKHEEEVATQSLNDQHDLPLESHDGRSSSLSSPPRDLGFHQIERREDATLDIMSIVKSSKTEEKCLRIKKIVRRPSRDDESSSLIEKLRNEIRETVSGNNITDISKAFDGELLSAFRSAICGSEGMNVNKIADSSQRARNVLLRKGKTRENLTKKVYATASGRRKRAWDRDLTVEFWKGRCLNGEPEKVKTLQSVLDLLKKVKSPGDDIGTEGALKSETDDSLLSRLYLADMTVLPRTENVKPLSALVDKNPESSVECSNPNKKLKVDGNVSRKAQLNGVKITKKNNELPKKTAISSASSMTDKRQWALEVLARKNSSSNSGPSQGGEEDHFLMGNYPLLAQLPLERRPVPELFSQCKIPISVRQAQLYRLAEYFLKRADAAEVELAIVDAVNTEKDICMRSKSKPVYVNICSQQMLHGRIPKTENVEVTVRSVDGIPEEVNAGSASTNNSVEETLRLAGLLSDSPPASPPPDDIPSVVSTSNSCLDSIVNDKAWDLEKSELSAENLESEVRLSTEIERPIPVAEDNANDHPEDNPSFASGYDAASDSCVVSSIHDKVRESELCLENVDLEARSLIEMEQHIPTENQQVDIPCRPKVPDLDSSISMINLCGDDSRIPVLEGKNKEKMPLHSFEVNLPGTGSSTIVENNIEQESTERESCSMPPAPIETVPVMDEGRSTVSKMVEAYIKEHIRPLCKSGVIRADQYRWAVRKTTDKVMKYHSKAKNASFLIKEGEKVRKLAQGYVEASQSKDWKPVPSLPSGN